MKAFITKSQVKLIADYFSAASKLVLGGGIITPLLQDKATFFDMIPAYIAASILFLIAFSAQGIADRMGNEYPNN